MQEIEKISDLSWRELLGMLGNFVDGKRKSFIFLNIVLFIVNFYNLIPALIVGLIVDFFVEYIKGGVSLQRFYYYILILGLSYILIAVIRLSVKRKLAEISADVRYRVYTKGFQSLLSHSLSWHEDENVGNKIERINNGSESLQRLVKIFENGIYDALSTYIGVIGVLFFIDIKFGLFVVVYIVFFSLIHILFYRKQTIVIDKLNKFKEESAGGYFESMSNMLAVKALGAHAALEEYIHTKEDSVRQVEYEKIRIINTKWITFQVFNGVSSFIFLLLVGRSVAQGIINIGSIVVFFNYFQKLISSSGDNFGLLDQLVHIKQEVSRMLPIFEKLKSKTGTNPFPENWSSLYIKDLNFSYQNKKESFQLTIDELQIKKGQHIGIIGESGSGKSTFMKILLGLYAVENGMFRIDTIDYSSIADDEIFNNISVVLQESELFNLSLKENITLFQRYDEKRFKEVLRIAQLENLLEKLPEKEHTLIGEKGYLLSGGERQRIGIARALYKNPQIILLDEATSNLDIETQHKIINAIQHAYKDKTLITIAHRLQILEATDYIFVFDKGKILNQGRYEVIRKIL